MLRRALIFLCLLAPLAAGAQTSDSVLITLRDSSGNVLTTPLGRIRCSGATNFDDPRVSFSWSLTPQTATTPAYATTDTYRLSVTKDSACPTSPTNGAGLIDSVSALSATGSYPASGNTLLLSNLLSKIPADCNASTADLTVRLCVSLVRGSNGTVDKTINNSFVMQLAAPPNPAGISVTPGDSALNISWTPGTVAAGQADNDRYVVQVAPRNPADDLGGARTKVTAATSFRQAGLKNGVLYDVLVGALSAGGNPSELAITSSGTPAPVNDFFTQYKADGGLEEGGCAGGPAGLLSLLGLGAALRLLRRRS